MSFNTLLSQDHIINYFKSVIESNHLAHAYIFTGQEGVGKSLFTKEFIKALTCLENENGHCDVCHNCSRINGHNHPDVHWEVLDKKEKFIKIERVRNLQHTASLCPVELNSKIFVIQDAERMNEEAANCLLKTIEEPTPNTLFILITNSLSRLKKTIVSRCQVIRFKSIHSQVIREYLMKKFNNDGEEIEWAAKYSCGSIGKACALLKEDFFKENNNVINKISRLNTEQNISCAEEFVNSALTPTRSLEEGRQVLRDILNCILRYYRDMLIFKINKRENSDKARLPLFNANRSDTIQLHSDTTSQETIVKIIYEILFSLEYLDANVNIHLLIESLFIRISGSNNQR
ncbi:MAG: DNA polymerase III subunit delta' [Candidatus Scalindua sp. AMX11]|nr:DNA polymerase III subunit delta' [Planctomycetota bacterium]RZV77568.1 MAG: DNA polymerase III subunit delta' [Candidatus Scalindua sp. SCAELEC01]TDE64552.1 MAG: DNA polymerase III subunit delta' [Candidatus Scalindua sp. AMX11]